MLALVDGRAESPMESRARMALVLGGLPPPAAQDPVIVRGRRYYLRRDLRVLTAAATTLTHRAW